jgi:hypothetical protein
MHLVELIPTSWPLPLGAEAEGGGTAINLHQDPEVRAASRGRGSAAVASMKVEEAPRATGGGWRAVAARAGRGGRAASGTWRTSFERDAVALPSHAVVGCGGQASNGPSPACSTK